MLALAEIGIIHLTIHKIRDQRRGENDQPRSPTLMLKKEMFVKIWRGQHP
jgi:hypothetical protein